MHKQTTHHKHKDECAPGLCPDHSPLWCAQKAGQLIDAKQEKRLEIFFICQRRLRWLGHIRRMEDGRVPKDLLYGELSTKRRKAGRSQLRYKDFCKRDMKTCDIDTNTGERTADHRSAWRNAMKNGPFFLFGRQENQAEAETASQPLSVSSPFTCRNCGRERRA